MNIPNMNIPSMNTNTPFFQSISRMFQHTNDKIFKYINTKILLHSKYEFFDSLKTLAQNCISVCLSFNNNLQPIKEEKN
jgi:hypothetical protein